MKFPKVMLLALSMLSGFAIMALTGCKNNSKASSSVSSKPAKAKKAHKAKKAKPGKMKKARKAKGSKCKTGKCKTKHNESMAAAVDATSDAAPAAETESKASGWGL